MMKRKGVFFLAAVCLLSVMLLPGAKKQADSVSQTVSPSDSQQPDNAQDAQALFPELSEDEITGIRIAAPDDCEFTFSVSEKNGLSVNGQKADSAVFSTLVDQLLSPSFMPVDAFEPTDEPVVTMTVCTERRDFIARFYTDQNVGKYAYVITGAESSRCLKTDAWRVGTLLLTCEGTRIFDASGQETPAE